MILKVIGALVAMGGVLRFAYFQGYLAGGEDGEEAYREGYNKGFGDAVDLAKRRLFDWQNPTADAGGGDK